MLKFNKKCKLISVFQVLILIFLNYHCHIHAQSPNFSWAISSDGTNLSRANSITSDSERNVYVAGYFWGTNDFDPGPEFENITSLGIADAFIQKLDTNGLLLWVKTIGGGDYTYFNSIIIDNDGNIYLTGLFYNTVDFDSGPGFYLMTSIGQADAFVLKLDSNGDFIWAVSFGGNAFEEGNALIVDSAGDIYITGGFSSAFVDFNPGIGTFPLSSGVASTFILKLDSISNFVWARSIISSGALDEGTNIALDDYSNVYVSGFFEETVSFDLGDTLSSNGYEDAFLAKFNLNGTFLWAQTIGGNGADKAMSVSIDNAGNSYLTGYFSSSVDFDPSGANYYLNSAGDEDIFIQKLDSSGNFIWAKSMGGTLTDIGMAVVIDDSSNLYLTGNYSTIVDFESDILNSSGLSDIFLMKLDSLGTTQWTKSVGGNGFDYPSAITIDSISNIYIVGTYFGTVDFDPGIGINSLSGTSDYFVLKLGWPKNYLTDFSDLNEYVTIYPNPTVEYLKIEQNGTSEMLVKLIDSNGKRIKSWSSSDQSMIIDMTHYSSGTYFLKIQRNDQTQLTKISKL